MNTDANIFFECNAANEAFEFWLDKLVSLSAQNQQSNSGDVAGEILNAITVIKDPTRNFVTSDKRSLSVRYALGELAWYLSGRNDLSGIQKFTKNWDKFSDDGVTVNSNYGWCIKKKFGFNQWEFVRETLAEFPDTRQAVIHIKEPNQNYSKDVNCTVCLQFFIRDEKLYLTTYMRSNDIWLGFPYDVFQFCFMQVLMSMELGVNLGTYTHIAGSLHLYKSNFESFNN